MRHYADPDFRPEEYERLRETRLAEEDIFHGKIMHVRKDTVRLPNGDAATREMIVHVGAVCVVPVTEDGQVYVERQFRYPLGQVITEIPAGKLDSNTEDILEAAKRELREETGLTAERWLELGLCIWHRACTKERRRWIPMSFSMWGSFRWQNWWKTLWPARSRTEKPRSRC